jgi:hypothetical protein
MHVRYAGPFYTFIDMLDMEINYDKSGYAFLFQAPFTSTETPIEYEVELSRLAVGERGFGHGVNLFSIP